MKRKCEFGYNLENMIFKKMKIEHNFNNKSNTNTSTSTNTSTTTTTTKKRSFCDDLSIILQVFKKIKLIHSKDTQCESKINNYIQYRRDILVYM